MPQNKQTRHSEVLHFLEAARRREIAEAELRRLLGQTAAAPVGSTPLGIPTEPPPAPAPIPSREAVDPELRRMPGQPPPEITIRRPEPEAEPPPPSPTPGLTISGASAAAQQRQVEAARMYNEVAPESMRGFGRMLGSIAKGALDATALFVRAGEDTLSQIFKSQEDRYAEQWNVAKGLPKDAGIRKGARAAEAIEEFAEGIPRLEGDTFIEQVPVALGSTLPIMGSIAAGGVGAGAVFGAGMYKGEILERKAAQKLRRFYRAKYRQRPEESDRDYAVRIERMVTAKLSDPAMAQALRIEESTLITEAGAIATGAAEVVPLARAVNRVVPAAARLFMRTPGKDSLLKAAEGAKQSMGLATVKAAATESAEEAVQEFAGELAVQYLAEEPTDAGAALHNAALGAAVGGILGAGTGAMGNALDTLYIEQQEEIKSALDEVDQILHEETDLLDPSADAEAQAEADTHPGPTGPNDGFRYFQTTHDLWTERPDIVEQGWIKNRNREPWGTPEEMLTAYGVIKPPTYLDQMIEEKRKQIIDPTSREPIDDDTPGGAPPSPTTNEEVSDTAKREEPEPPVPPPPTPGSGGSGPSGTPPKGPKGPPKLPPSGPGKPKQPKGPPDGKPPAKRKEDDDVKPPVPPDDTKKKPPTPPPKGTPPGEPPSGTPPPKPPSGEPKTPPGKKPPKQIPDGKGGTTDAPTNDDDTVTPPDPQTDPNSKPPPKTPPKPPTDKPPPSGTPPALPPGSKKGDKDREGTDKTGVDGDKSGKPPTGGTPPAGGGKNRKPKSPGGDGKPGTGDGDGSGKGGGGVGGPPALPPPGGSGGNVPGGGGGPGGTGTGTGGGTGGGKGGGVGGGSPRPDPEGRPKGETPPEGVGGTDGSGGGTSGGGGGTGGGGGGTGGGTGGGGGGGGTSGGTGGTSGGRRPRPGRSRETTDTQDVPRQPGGKYRYRYDPNNDTLWPRSDVNSIRAALTALLVWKRRGINFLERDPEPPHSLRNWGRLEQIAQYGGFGAMKSMWGANPSRQEAELKVALRRVMGTDAEFDAFAEVAKESSLNAHYTRPDVATGMWEALENVARDAGDGLQGRGVEPGAGVGVFSSTMPRSLDSAGVTLHRLDIDPLAAQIGALVSNKDPYELRDLRKFNAKNRFEFSIGNVPFAGQLKIPVQGIRENQSLHNAAILKALDAVKPGGHVMLITSRFTLDSKSNLHRKEMYRRADLIGALRLPTGMFGEAAGTDVITDILWFRKRNAPLPDESVEGHTVHGEWIDTKTWHRKDDNGFDIEIDTNKIFELTAGHIMGTVDQRMDDKRRAHVAGHITLGMEMGHPGIKVSDTASYFKRGPGGQYGNALPLNAVGNQQFIHDMLHQLAENAHGQGMDISFSPQAAARGGGPTAQRHTVELEEGRQAGEIYAEEGEDKKTHFYQIVDITKIVTPSPELGLDQYRYEAVVEELIPKNDQERAALEVLVPLNPLARKLVRMHKDDTVTDEELWDFQREVKSAYHKAIGKLRRGPLKRYKYLSTIPLRARQRFDRSTDGAYVYLLEKPVPGGKYSTSDYLRLDVRVGMPPPPPEAAATLQDAIVISLASKERAGSSTLDLPHIAALLSQHPDDVLDDLRKQKLAFWDAEAQQVVLAQEFLTGDMRTKLERYEAMHNESIERGEEESGLELEIAAIKRALPAWKSMGSLEPRFGDDWIPARYKREFLRQHTGRTIIPQFNPASGLWTFETHGSFTSEFVQSIGNWRQIAPGFFAINPLKRPMDFIELMFNNKAIKPSPPKDDRGRAVRDMPNELKEEANEHLQQVRRGIERDFLEYLSSDPGRRQIVERNYNYQMNAHAVAKPFDPGASWRPAGLASKFDLRTPQRLAAFRALIKGSGGIFHWVGTGKTITMAAIAMEYKRLGLANKSMVVVDLPRLEATAREFKEAFPHAEIHWAKTGTSGGRLTVSQQMQRIATGQHDIVLVSKEQFKAMELNPNTQARAVEAELEQLEAALRQEQEQGVRQSDSAVYKQVIRLRDKLSALQERAANWNPGQVDFEDLGVDNLLIDEAHQWKGLPVPSSIQELAGGSTSERAMDLLAKTHWLDQVNPGRGVHLATGTPVVNNVPEIWTMFKYINQQYLRDMGHLDVFQNFANRFVTMQENMEQNPKGEWVSKARPFYRNLDVLQKIMWDLSTVVSNDEVAQYVQRPVVERVLDERVQGEMDEQDGRAFRSWIRARAEEAYEALGDPERRASHTDILPVIAADAELGAVDLRILDGAQRDNPKSLLNKSVDNIFKEYQDSADNKGTQAVFLDKYRRFEYQYVREENEDGTWKIVRKKIRQYGINGQEEIRRKLIHKGIPKEQIVLVNELSTAKRAELWDKINSGEVRVVIGVTDSMGRGVNMQERMIAMHHLDPPMKPLDIIQREGRIDRPGNTNPKVRIYTYSTKGATTSGWVRIFRKARAFEKLLSNEPMTAEEMADLSDTAPTASQIISSISGSETVNIYKQFVDIVRELQAQKQSIQVRRGSLAEQIASAEERVNDAQIKVNGNQSILDFLREAAEGADSDLFETHDETESNRDIKGQKYDSLNEMVQDVFRRITADLPYLVSADEHSRGKNDAGFWEGDPTLKKAADWGPSLTRLQLYLQDQGVPVRSYDGSVRLGFGAKGVNFELKFVGQRQSFGSTNRKWNGDVVVTINKYLWTASRLALQTTERNDDGDNVVIFKTGEQLGRSLASTINYMLSLKRRQTDLEASQKQLETAESDLATARQGIQTDWTTEQERQLQEAIAERDRVGRIAAAESNQRLEHDMLNMQEWSERMARGLRFSATRSARGIRPDFLSDRRPRLEAEKIVRKIFPAVKGVFFSSALYGYGPALRQSKLAAGERQSRADEVGGMVDRARGIVEISLDSQFDIYETAHHEAYHLARMLASEEEIASLEAEFASEEEEAVAFADRMTHRSASVWARFFRKVWLVFSGIGRMLRGYGYRGVDHIFEDFVSGKVGARLGVAESHREIAEVAYTARRRGVRPDKVAGVLDKPLNEATEMPPEYEDMVAQARERLGYQNPGTSESVDSMAEKARRAVDEGQLLARRGTPAASEIAMVGIIWRLVARDAMVQLGATAQKIKNGDQSDQTVADLDKAYNIFQDAYSRSTAYASEIGLALRMYGAPIGKFTSDRMRDLESILNNLNAEPGKGPGKGPGDGPGEGPGDGGLGGEGPGKGPGDGPGKGPGDGPGKGPGKGPGEGKGKGPGKGPGDGPGKGPGEGKGKGPGDGPGKGPGDGGPGGEGPGGGTDTEEDGPEIPTGKGKKFVKIPWSKFMELSKKAKYSIRKKGIPHEDLKAFIQGLYRSELESMIDLWKRDPLKFHKLLDVFIKIGQMGSEKSARQALEQFAQGDWKNWVKWGYYNSLVSSLTTLLWRNPFGGALQTFFSMPGATVVTAVTDTAGRKVLGWNETDMFNQAPRLNELNMDRLFGSASDWGAAWDGFKAMWFYGKDNDPQGQYEPQAANNDIAALAGEDSFWARPVWQAGVGMFWPVRVLAATDKFFRTLVTRRELRGHAMSLLRLPGMREALDIGDDVTSTREWIDLFVEEAPTVFVALSMQKSREATYTQPLKGFGKLIDQYRERFWPMYGLIPFLKILYNTTAMGLRRTFPVSALRPDVTGSGPSRLKMMNEIRKGGRARAEELQRQQVALAIPIIAYFMVSSGHMTGSGEEDPARRRVWRMLRQPGSILVNGRWHYTADWTEHLSLPLMAWATFFEILGLGTTHERGHLTGEGPGNFENATSKLYRMTLSVFDAVADKSFAQGVGQLYKARRHPEDNVQTINKYLASLLTPKIWDWIQRRRQEHLYDISDPMHPWQERGVPPGSDAIPPRLDPFGDPLDVQTLIDVPIKVQGSYRTWQPFQGTLQIGEGDAGKPWAYGQPTDEPLYEQRKQQMLTELVRVGKGFSHTPRSIAGGIRLEPWERHRFGQLQGWARYNALETILGDPNYWRTNSDALRLRLINEAVQAFSMPETFFIAIEAQNGNRRLLDRYIELHGPMNWGRVPSIPGRALQ